MHQLKVPKCQSHQRQRCQHDQRHRNQGWPSELSDAGRGGGRGYLGRVGFVERSEGRRRLPCVLLWAPKLQFDWPIVLRLPELLLVLLSQQRDLQMLRHQQHLQRFVQLHLRGAYQQPLLLRLAQERNSYKNIVLPSEGGRLSNCT